MRLVTKNKIISDVISASFTDVLGQIGKATFRIPYKFNSLFSDNQPNQKIQFIRRNSNGENDNYYFWVQSKKKNDTKDAEIEINCIDSVGLLNKRIVAYKDTTAQADKETSSFLAMCELVNENIGTDSVTARQLPLIIYNNIDFGPEVSVKTSFKNLISALKDVQDQSLEAGYETMYRFWYDGTRFIFSPYLNYVRDRRKFMFNKMELLNQVEVVDFDKAVNSVYVGGSGKGNDRLVVQATNSADIIRGDYNVKEMFANLSNVTDTPTLGAIGNQILSQNRNKETLSFEISETKNKPFSGRTGWRTGDIVSVLYNNKAVPCLIRGIKYDLSQNGSEKVIAKIEV